MRNKAHLSDLNVLFVCPSRNWGTVERKVLQDALYLRNSGSNTRIYCLKNSPLALEALNEALNVQYYEKGEIKSDFDLSYFLDLRTLINSKSFDVVHCYGLEFIWPLCVVLKKYPLTPLFLTINKMPIKNYKTFWYKILATRIDSLISFDEFLMDVIKANLPIKQTRLHFLGTGVDTIYQGNGEKRDEEYWKVGCYIPQPIKQISEIVPIFNSIRALFYDNKNNQQDHAVLILFTDCNWNQHHLNKELRGLIVDMGLENYIRLENKLRPLKDLSTLDIFLGIESSEPFYDYEINALIHRIPIVVPRTSSRESLLGVKNIMGETYKLKDSREMMVKMKKIMTRYESYSKNIHHKFNNLRDGHSLELYAEELFGLYEKLIIWRQRLNAKRLNK